ncbi:MAG: 4-hydroxythreonine-4-phosphate dehydrogenase PdxA [Alphaproteobacteria bacterium]|nr:4-hydroxythreonine-4-phosphate dehydrogenase PdxA [Alphaproteobacteria bacterium]
MTAPLALTMGEPAGIGGEITLMAWRDRVTSVAPPFFVIDDPTRLTALARAIGVDVPVRAIDDPSEAARVFPSALPVLAQALPRLPIPGQPDPANAPAVIAAVERAVTLVRNRQAGAVITNPIQKETLYDAGFAYPGHTEFLGALAHVAHPVMMLAGPELRVVPVTIHLSLVDALASLSTAAIVTCGRVTAAALTRDFGIARPRLAVAALNPHAGEAGAMGHEERDIIVPAVAALAAQGIDVSGPTPADTLFHAGARTRYDAVLCMYHDQALIPLKTLDFERGINITLGLPFIRTSPDHGTALDIAGQGVANPASLIAALMTAGVMAARRATQPAEA